MARGIVLTASRRRTHLRMRSLAAALPLVAILAACGEKGSGSSRPAAEEPAAPTAAPASAPGTTTSVPPPAVGEQGGTATWREVASTEDAGRLGRLEQAWRLARAEAEDKGFAEQVEALGPLVDPNAGQTGRLQPPPGT